MSDSTALCDVCGHRHLSKPSTVWCLDCKQRLCHDCREHHRFLKVTRSHSIISISEYQKIPRNVLEMKQYCQKHDEMFQIFCKKHDFPCCRKCIVETHNDCKNLIEFKEYIKDVKSSARFNELEEMLKEAAENIRRICIDRQNNITSLQAEKKILEKEIEQTRIKINNHLDKLQFDIIQELHATEEKENAKIQQVLNSLAEKQCQIKEYQNNFENIKKYATDVQIFLSMKQMENDMVKNEEFVQSMIDSDSLSQVVLVLKDTTATENITVDMPYIGNVGVDYSPSQVSITKKKEKQAQMMATKATKKSIENIAIELQQKIVSCGNGVTGCTLLPRGRMAFASEKYKSINIVKSDGSFDIKIDLKPYAPFDITYIPDNNTIAVTSRNSHDVTIIDLDTRKVLKTFGLFSNCAGIAYTNQKLLLCSGKKGILELNYHDGSVKTIALEKMSIYSYLASLGDRIFYTNLESKSVICYSLQGKLQWTFKNPILSGPLGVTVDTDGNIFVSGNGSHNVVVISPDGQHYKQLLSSEDGIEYPHGLIYDRKHHQLLVTTFNNGAFQYNSKE